MPWLSAATGAYYPGMTTDDIRRVYGAGDEKQNYLRAFGDLQNQFYGPDTEAGKWASTQIPLDSATVNPMDYNYLNREYSTPYNEYGSLLQGAYPNTYTTLSTKGDDGIHGFLKENGWMIPVAAGLLAGGGAALGAAGAGGSGAGAAGAAGAGEAFTGAGSLAYGAGGYTGLGAAGGAGVNSLAGAGLAAGGAASMAGAGAGSSIYGAMIPAAVGAIGSGVSGWMQAGAAEDAANIQANSANQANQLQYQMFKEQQALMQPWVDSGRANLGRLNNAMQPGGGLDPNYRYSFQDWQNSPEYAVYSGARDTAIRRGQENLLAQNAARGMYGSGNMANQLQQNVSDQYAMYDPASFSAAQQSALGQRNTAYNQMAGTSSPFGAQQVAQYAGQYGQNAGQNIVGAGNALANGQMGQANAWGNALTSGVNQVSNAYGNYQGQQNMNALLAMLQQNGGGGGGGGGVMNINPNNYSLGGNYSFTS